MAQVTYNGHFLQLASNANMTAFASQWQKSNSYVTNNVVWKNSVLYSAKHAIPANTDWSTDDWQLFTLNIMNRDVVHINGNELDMDYKMVYGCYINLGNVGTTITVDYGHNVSYDCMMFPVKKGDRISFIGAGGSTARLWGIIDNDNVIQQVSNASQTQTSYGYCVAEQDGYFIFNSQNNINHNVIFCPFDARSIQFLSKEKNLYKIDLLQYKTENQYISLSNKNIGDTVDITNYTGANQWNGIVIPVKTGDIIQVKGKCGSSPRLWCLTDNSYVIKDLSSASYYSDKITSLYVVEDGWFIGSYTTDTTSYYAEYNLIADTERFISLLANQFTDFTKNSYISLKKYIIEGAVATTTVGSAITYNGNTGWRTLKFPCKQGDVFELNGSAGSSSVLYAFTDSNLIVTERSDSSMNLTYKKRIIAPNDGYLIYNSYTSVSDYDILFYYNKFSDVNRILEFDNYCTFDLTSIAIADKYVRLNYNVGDTVEETITEDVGRSFVKIPVKAGDMIQMNHVSSGTAPRLWCLTDTDKKVLSISSASNNYTKYFTCVVSQDGYFYGDIKSYSGTAEYKFIGNQVRVNSVIQTARIATEELIVVNNDVCIENNNFIEQRCVDTSGSTADLSNLIVNKNIRILIMNCVVGDKFIITGHGANAYRLWAFVDNNGNVFSKANNGITLTNTTIVAPITGKFVMQSYMYSAPTDYKLLTNNREFCQNQLEKTEDDVIYLNRKFQPIVQFDKFYDIKNYETEIETFNFSGNVREQVQDHFDALVEANSDFMSKVDIYEETGISYPAYANYHTYMYKIEGDLVSMGNTNGRHPKKKVFIVAGVHGDELSAPVNTYLLAKNLCNVVDDTYFKLRSCCNFYIIPCVNGYGMEHVTRTNGNGVDINRNYPVAAWTESGSGTSQYTGSSAGSEAETQMVMAAFNLVKPDVAMDHHNYANTTWQLYAVCSTEEMSNVVYDVFTDCSYTFIKNLPEYFGNKFKIFNVGDAPKVLASYQDQTTNRWYYEQGIIDGCTCEISNNINFRNGETHTGNELLYKPIVWSVGEYTLRNMVVKMVQHNLEI